MIAFFLEAARCYTPENLTNCTRGLFLTGLFLNSDNLVHRLLELPRGHYSREFLDELALAFAIRFVPPTKPKSVACKVLEYVE